MGRLLRNITILAALGTALVSTTTPAQAAASSSSIVKTGGTRAAEAWFNRSDGSHAGKAWFDVYDAKCDANDVYVEYQINGGNSQEKYNSGGCGTTKGYNLQTGYFAIVYRVCVDDAGYNTCGTWRSDHN
ncbi:hypothetical protein Sru01_26930 [Sphaerisporangium rufum]|uniref:Secreted protein n=1 Tax=Sphaerisporangium rufum TaxID=1381558 RepID=A0A919UY59_9ACTN|nr:hypothetical protein [Sphaerisporangium rufum]GII77711.1 hypothetical protein Sru01_26930 [Sphaerisporangium rufum]